MAKKPKEKSEEKKEAEPSLEERIEKIEKFLVHTSSFSRD